MSAGDQASNPSGPKLPCRDVGPALLEVLNVCKKPEFWSYKNKPLNLKMELVNSKF